MIDPFRRLAHCFRPPVDRTEPRRAPRPTAPAPSRRVEVAPRPVAPAARRAQGRAAPRPAVTAALRWFFTGKVTKARAGAPASPPSAASARVTMVEAIEAVRATAPGIVRRDTNGWDI